MFHSGPTQTLPINEIEKNLPKKTAMTILTFCEALIFKQFLRIGNVLGTYLRAHTRLKTYRDKHKTSTGPRSNEKH